MPTVKPQYAPSGRRRARRGAVQAPGAGRRAVRGSSAAPQIGSPFCTHDSPGWNGFVKYLGIVAGGRAFVEHSLAAILAADAVGYSRIMREDEPGRSSCSTNTVDR
jgi:hypothetical protein